MSTLLECNTKDDYTAVGAPDLSKKIAATEAKHQFFLATCDLQNLSFERFGTGKYYDLSDVRQVALEKHSESGLNIKRSKRLRREEKKRIQEEEDAVELNEMFPEYHHPHHHPHHHHPHQPTFMEDPRNHPSKRDQQGMCHYSYYPRPNQFGPPGSSNQVASRSSVPMLAPPRHSFDGSFYETSHRSRGQPLPIRLVKPMTMSSCPVEMAARVPSFISRHKKYSGDDLQYEPYEVAFLHKTPKCHSTSFDEAPRKGAVPTMISVPTCSANGEQNSSEDLCQQGDECNFLTSSLDIDNNTPIFHAVKRKLVEGFEGVKTPIDITGSSPPDLFSPYYYLLKNPGDEMIPTSVQSQNNSEYDALGVIRIQDPCQNQHELESPSELVKTFDTEDRNDENTGQYENDLRDVSKEIEAKPFYKLKPSECKSSGFSDGDLTAELQIEMKLEPQTKCSKSNTRPSTRSEHDLPVLLYDTSHADI